LTNRQIRGFGVGSRENESVVQVFVNDAVRARADGLVVPTRFKLTGIPEQVEAVVVSEGPVRPVAAPAATSSSGDDIGRADQGWSGTLGCLVRRRGHNGTYLLSNAHVLALTGVKAPAMGDEIVSPSYGNGGRAPNNTVGRLANWTRFAQGAGYPNLADAAIAELIGLNAGGNANQLNVDAGINENVVEKMTVRVHGAASGRVRSGQVTALNVCHELTYPQYDAPVATFGFRGLVSCSTGAEDGDSGAVVLDEDNRLLGLLFAGSATTSLFTPIRTVFDLLELSLDSSGTAGAANLQPVPPLGFKPQVVHGYTAVDVLARTLWGEARNQGEEGMIGVAAVIANRTHAQRAAWGLTVEDVCKAPLQFSCWNEPKTASDQQNRASMDSVGPENSLFALCLDVGRRTLSGDIVDPTHGANHYCNLAVAQPQWALNQVPTTTIRNHSFYKL
jgi:hypothetical protein